MGLPCHRIRAGMARLDSDLRWASLVVDALLGTGLARDLKGPLRRVVEEMNRSRKRIVSVDVPSGLDADSGKICGVAIQAHCTVALGCVKKGLLRQSGPAVAGRVVIGDIGFPMNLSR